MISVVSDLSSLLVFLTAFMLLVDKIQAYCLIWIRHHQGVSRDQTPIATTLMYTMLPVAVTQTIYVIFFLFCMYNSYEHSV